MKRPICIVAGIAAVTTAALAQVGQTGPAASGGRAGEGSRTASPAPAVEARKTLDAYCTSCHNSRVRAGGVAFDALPLDAVHEHADVWETAVRKLRGRLMPPPGSRQPDQRELDAFVTWMEAALDRSAAGNRVAGHVPIQRLTRTEFGAAVNDLLGIELDADALLPAEIEVHGFDNIAAALSISPRSSISTWPPRVSRRASPWVAPHGSPARTIPCPTTINPIAWTGFRSARAAD
jgi:cytochrome c5